MGAMTLGSFIGVLYARTTPNMIMVDCNHSSEVAACEPVFKARSTAYGMLTFFLLVHGVNCRDSRRSIFRMRLFENKLLWYIIIAAFIGTVLTIYIPFVNTEWVSEDAVEVSLFFSFRPSDFLLPSPCFDSIFMQTYITWEWGVLIAGQLIFLACAEMYKLWKRRSDFWNPPRATPTGVHLGEGDEVEHENPEEGYVHYDQRLGVHHGSMGRTVDESLAKGHVSTHTNTDIEMKPSAGAKIQAEKMVSNGAVPAVPLNGTTAAVPAPAPAAAATAPANGGVEMTPDIIALALAVKGDTEP